MTRPCERSGTAGTETPSLTLQASHGRPSAIHPWPKLGVTENAVRGGKCPMISIIPASLVVPPPKGGCVGALRGRHTP